MALLDELPRIHRFAFIGDIDAARQCLLEGDDIDELISCETQSGHPMIFVSALYLAAQQGNTEMCRFLVNQGIDTTVKCYLPHSDEYSSPQSIAMLYFRFATWSYLKTLQAPQPNSSQKSTEDVYKPLLSSS